MLTQSVNLLALGPLSQEDITAFIWKKQLQSQVIIQSTGMHINSERCKRKQTQTDMTIHDFPSTKRSPERM